MTELVLIFFLRIKVAGLGHTLLQLMTFLMILRGGKHDGQFYKRPTGKSILLKHYTNKLQY